MSLGIHQGSSNFHRVYRQNEKRHANEQQVAADISYRCISLPEVGSTTWAFTPPWGGVLFRHSVQLRPNISRPKTSRESLPFMSLHYFSSPRNLILHFQPFFFSSINFIKTFFQIKKILIFKLFFSFGF